MIWIHLALFAYPFDVFAELLGQENFDGTEYSLWSMKQ